MNVWNVGHELQGQVLFGILCIIFILQTPILFAVTLMQIEKFLTNLFYKE